jgi:hypothetical protein
MAIEKSVSAVIEASLAGKDARLKETVTRLRTFVKKAVPKLQETLNPWGIATFESDGPFSYFLIGKHHVTFGFLRGTSLADPKGLLEGTGKNVRHVKLRSPDDIDRLGLVELVRGAAALNRASPPSVMGGPKRQRTAKKPGDPNLTRSRDTARRSPSSPRR